MAAVASILIESAARHLCLPRSGSILSNVTPLILSSVSGSSGLLAILTQPGSYLPLPLDRVRYL